MYFSHENEYMKYYIFELRVKDIIYEIPSQLHVRTQLKQLRKESLKKDVISLIFTTVTIWHSRYLNRSQTTSKFNFQAKNTRERLNSNLL